MPADLYVGKSMLHMYEEPCISAEHGAGAIFFSGCNLRGVYCQNRKISLLSQGKRTSESELEKIIFGLCEQGAECIEFITPTHYTDRLANLLYRIKPKLSVPVVWNSGGYEKVETLRALNELVDIYLPDFKYFSSELSLRYSAAGNYPEVCTDAIKEMLRQTGKPKYSQDGKKLAGGVIVRHLVLPGCRHDSINILRHLRSIVEPDDIILSLMSQYTPDFYMQNRECVRYKNLERKLTSFEYNSVLSEATRLGFSGYFQHRDSASAAFTPDF